MSSSDKTHGLSPALELIVQARHHDPFSVLGRHHEQGDDIVRAFFPSARKVRIENGPELTPIKNTGLFEGSIKDHDIPLHYALLWTDAKGQAHRSIEPYTFAPQIPDFDLYLFGTGKHWHIYRILGASLKNVDGVDGTLFAVWAPNAERVSVVGDFNQWDGRRHPMRCRYDSGVWELFVPGLGEGTLYKFEIRNRHSGDVFVKTDPYGRFFELRPNTAAIVVRDDQYEWNDRDWMRDRQQWDWQHSPMSVYEVHLGAWRRDKDGGFLGYRELARQLVEYVKEQGFTHLELMPVTEHPLDISWGYQTTGYYAPTSRFGSPDDFRWFVDYCHQNDIGVIIDWVPAHFPKDAWALAWFDGAPLYEHADPRRGEHPDWGTLIYDYGRNEVRNFLFGSAMYWLEEFHIDGLRVDAVASMLYLDYSRQPGEWIPNKYGSNENLEAIDFLRELNNITQEQHPGTVVIAEESTAWPQVTRPPWVGGLGFAMKWNMGWMHDTLAFLANDPVYRQYHHDQLTFGLLYAFTENFVLPFSHDEVVHGKGSMLTKMPGDEWQRFANLRLLYTYMLTYPGKKLLFMGSELAQPSEWDVERELEWDLLQYPLHQGVQSLVADLNRLYRNQTELHQYDFESQGFEWVDCHDSSQSTLSYLRRSADDFLLVALNFTPVPRHDYRLGVPEPGAYQEILNSDSQFYGGSNLGNGWIEADPIPWMGRPYSISITLPPLAGVVFCRQPEETAAP
ncbi:MAG: 1,4-alpha-glucan branching protein GlgB [Methylothermaceae bacterium]|nr:1,4-alpha-glucan branching protein GlgB [Methylothermaceae bacterium]